MTEADHTEYREKCRAAADVSIERLHAGGGDDLSADEGRRAVLLKVARDVGHHGDGDQHGGKRRHGDKRLLTAERSRADQRRRNGADHGDHREQEEVHGVDLIDKEQERCGEEPRDDAGCAERIIEHCRDKNRSRDAAEERRGQHALRLVGLLHAANDAVDHRHREQRTRDDAEDRQRVKQP